MAYLSEFHDQWDAELRDVVGRIAIAYGQLEHVVKLAYKRITGKTLAEAMDFADQLRSNAHLAAEVKEVFARRAMRQDRESELDDIVKTILEISRIRNFLIHGYWHRKQDTGELRITKDNKRFDITETSSQDLNQLYAQIIRVRNALNIFTRRPISRTELSDPI